MYWHPPFEYLLRGRRQVRFFVSVPVVGKSACEVICAPPSTNATLHVRQPGENSLDSKSPWHTITLTLEAEAEAEPEPEGGSSGLLRTTTRTASIHEDIAAQQRARAQSAAECAAHNRQAAQDELDLQRILRLGATFPRDS